MASKDPVSLLDKPVRRRHPPRTGGGGVWTGLFFSFFVVQIITTFPSFVDATTNSNSNTNRAGASSAQSCGVNPTAATPGSPKASITALASDEEQATTTKKKKTKTKKSTPMPKKKIEIAGSSSSSSSLSTTQSVFVRRIQSEWRDAVKMGVAYDWVEGKAIQSKKQKNKKKNKKKKHDSSTTEPDAVTAAAEDDDGCGDGSFGGEETKHHHHHQYFCLGPMGSNLFVWDFTFLGMENSIYDGGLYHGRLILPPQYPSSPPRVQVWTPSGRFVPGADICLSASAFHPETWNPAAFNLRTIIESLRLHMMTPPTEIGGTKASPEKKQKLAKESRTWTQTLTVNPSKKSAGCRPKIVEIDHSKMIEQGLFPSLINTATEEKENGNTTKTSPSAAFGLEDAISEYMNEQQEKGNGGKTKKREGGKSKSKSTTTKESVSIKREQTGLFFLTVKTILNNRLIRMAILFLIIFKAVFG